MKIPGAHLQMVSSKCMYQYKFSGGGGIKKDNQNN